MTWEFSNLPRKLTLLDYDNARQEITKYFHANEDIIAIYEYGSVSAPGVSDLDIILVLRDKLEITDQYLDFQNINGDANSFVADGNVIKMPRGVFEKIQYFDALNARLLTGEAIMQYQNTPPDQAILKLISVVDWLPERLLRLNKILSSKKINVANTLCVLHSLGYSLATVGSVLAIDKHENILRRIAILRSNNNPNTFPTGELLEVLFHALRLGQDYLFYFASYLISSEHVSVSNLRADEAASLELYSDCVLRFSDQSQNAQIKFQNSESSKISSIDVVVPIAFLPHFAALGSRDSPISAEVKRKSRNIVKSAGDQLSESYKRILFRKLNLAEENAEFLRSNNLSGGLIRYGFHYEK